MQHAETSLRGSYRYASREHLEEALADAREQLDDDDHHIERAWARMFVPRGTTLRVDLVLHDTADPLCAAGVLEILAQRAIEGVVEACGAHGVLGWFPSGSDD